MRNAEEFVFQALGLGLMEIDSYGRVWWIRRQQTSRWGDETKIVDCARKRAEKSWNGKYLQVHLMLQGMRGIAGAHRLVWFYFNGRIPSGLTINHKDGNKHNNHPANLELATHSEQSLHAYHVLGFRPAAMFKSGHAGSSGEVNGASKLTRALILEIRQSSDKGVVLASRFGVSATTISRVRNDVLWKEVSCERR
jgi:hypothetical protein